MKSTKSNTVRTTLTIPADLLEATDQLVQMGYIRSRNQFVALALRHEIEAHQRALIDTAFAETLDDTEYPVESGVWEAFELSMD